MNRAVLVIAVCALCTLLERALPLLLFRGEKVPGWVRYLGKVLPAAIIMTLVIYSLRSLGLSRALVPYLIACAVTVGLHLWRRNAFLSIVAGTLTCMLLTQFVF